MYNVLGTNGRTQWGYKAGSKNIFGHLKAKIM